MGNVTEREGGLFHRKVFNFVNVSEVIETYRFSVRHRVQPEGPP